MTAAKAAKRLGAKSLKQVAEVYQTTPQNLDHMFKTSPNKFEIVVRGVISALEERE